MKFHLLANKAIVSRNFCRQVPSVPVTLFTLQLRLTIISGMFHQTACFTPDRHVPIYLPTRFSGSHIQTVTPVCARVHKGRQIGISRMYTPYVFDVLSSVMSNQMFAYALRWSLCSLPLCCRSSTKRSSIALSPCDECRSRQRYTDNECTA